MQLSISNLSKLYPNGVQALKNVSLDIPIGMFGLLGPNGAGKSTLMRTFATLQDADTGTATLGDIDVLKEKKEVRKVLGYLPQDFGVYPNLNAEEMLDHFARLKGIHDNADRKMQVEALLEQTNLTNYRKRKVGTYSGGMRQRFGIAQALIGNPKLVIVDEPTAGLDPAERNRFHNLLSEIGENIIVILSTHIVEDVNDLCENMAIIHRGEVLRAGQPEALLGAVDGKIWELEIEKNRLAEMQAAYPVISVRHFAGRLKLRVLAEETPADGFNKVAPNLEDIYFSAIREREKPVVA